MKTYKAHYFDGKTARSFEVELSVQFEQVEIKGDGTHKYFKLIDLLGEAPFASAPLVLETAAGERIEIGEYDKELLDSVLKSPSKLMLFIERNKWMLSGIIVSSLIFGFFFVKMGVPLLSRTMAGLINQEILNSVDKHILNTLDTQLLKPSKLSEQTKVEVRNYFLKNETRDDIQVLFRGGGRMGANALALSGKTVIFTDELVNKLANKKLLYTIYLHEKGHLEHRHMARRIIQVSIYNFVLFFLTSDMEGATETLANAGATLISLSYSRDDEREADVYSIESLNDFNLSPLCFSKAMNLFVNNTKDYASVQKSSRDFLSTHPNPGERVGKALVLFPDSNDCQDEGYELVPKDPEKPSQDLLNLFQLKN